MFELFINLLGIGIFLGIMYATGCRGQDFAYLVFAMFLLAGMGGMFFVRQGRFSRLEDKVKELEQTIDELSMKAEDKTSPDNDFDNYVP